MKFLRCVVVLALVVVGFSTAQLVHPGAAMAAPAVSYVQGSSFATGSRLAATTAPLGQPVSAGDLLVGWFAAWEGDGVSQPMQVSDNVNGAWTRAPGSLSFGGNGDIALYYLSGSKAAANGLTITVSAPTSAYFQGAVAEYSGVAAAGALDRIAMASGNTAAVDSGPTGAAAAGELVYGAVLTASAPGSNATPGSSQGVNFTPRVNTGSAFEEDITSSAAGAQDARAAFAGGVIWYAVVVTFNPTPANAQPPTTPTGLKTTNVTATQVALSWTASTDNVPVTGYTIYRDGTQIGTSSGSASGFTDSSVSAGATYSYTVDAFNGAGQHSGQSPPLSVTVAAIRFVQGGSVLNQPIGAGDLLVGWFAEYNSGAGQLQVSDSVNGAWTEAPGSLSFAGNGQIALFYFQNSHASASGATIQITAPSGASVYSTVAEYSGVASAGALDQIAMRAGSGTSVDSGPTGSVSGAELVFGALITGAFHTGVGTVTPGSSQGVAFTPRYSGGNGSVFEEDITAPGPGAQDATASLNYTSDWYAVAATFRPAAGSQPPPPPPVGYVQGAALSTGGRVGSAQIQLGRAVAAGDLLVGWFAQYNVSGSVQVSDNVNGAWTRAPGSTTFWGSGDIALYYRPNSQASAGGLTVTVSAPAAAYLSGAVAEYSGVATSGALDQVVSARNVGTAVAVCTSSQSGCPGVGAVGELTYGALVTGGSPATVTPGTTGGVAFTARASTPSGSAFEEDITSSPAFPGLTATLGTSTDWYAVVATFHPGS